MRGRTIPDGGRRSHTPPPRLDPNAPGMGRVVAAPDVFDLGEPVQSSVFPRPDRSDEGGAETGRPSAAPPPSFPAIARSLMRVSKAFAPPQGLPSNYREHQVLPAERRLGPSTIMPLDATPFGGTFSPASASRPTSPLPLSQSGEEEEEEEEEKEEEDKEAAAAVGDEGAASGSGEIAASVSPISSTAAKEAPPPTPAKRPPHHQDELADPSWFARSRLPPHTRMGDRAGRFFTDVSEDTFFAASVAVSTADHADFVLRAAGLIKQTGTVRQYLLGHQDVYYDERIRLWRHVTTNAEMYVDAKLLVLREDAVPNGIISVVGTLDCGNFVSEKERALEQARHRETESELGNAEGQLKDRLRKARGGSGGGDAVVKRQQHQQPMPLLPSSLSPNSATSNSFAGRTGRPVRIGASRRSSSATPFGGLRTATAAAAAAAAAHHYPGTSPSPMKLRSPGETRSPRDSTQISTLRPSTPYDPQRPFDGYDTRVYDNDDRNVEGIIDIGDPAAEFLSKAEILKFVKHYLCRAVVTTAKGTGSCILASGADDISRLLGSGYFALCDPLAAQPFTPSEVPPLLVGVNPLVSALKQRLDPRFSRHILLEGKGSHKFDVLRRACEYCGAKFTKDLRNKCEFCPKRTPTDIGQVGTVLEAVSPANPSPEEFVGAKHALLEALHNGFSRDATLRMEQPPNRPSVPVVVVVVGGDDLAAQEVRRAAAKGWPLLVVAESGGYASRICGAIDKVNSLRPDAGPDEFRKLLSSIDPGTSAVINTGKLEIVRPGTSVLQFQRLLHNALKGDQILRKAWVLYSLWKHNANEYKFMWQMSSIVLLLVGLGATLASVLQTFLILYWNFEGKNNNNVAEWRAGIVKRENKYAYMLFVSCQWLVIGLPIMLTLLHAIFQRFNPWGKLRSLRIASDSLLREIYMYRMRTHRYSSSAIRAASRRQRTNLGTSVSASAAAAESVEQFEEKSKTEGSKAASRRGGRKSSGNPTSSSDDDDDDDDDLVGGTSEIGGYSSREELLGIMIVRLQSALAVSAVKETALRVPVDSTPPRHIAAFGDTGFNDLKPDDYVRFRLLPAKFEYEEEATSASQQLVVLMSMVVVFSAAGTTIAAIASYGLGYLQAWVALATAVVNSFNRFLDATRLASLAELGNVTTHRLSDVERWWLALGRDADDDANLAKLVSDTEGIIGRELEDWAKQIEVSQEEMRKQEEQHNKAKAEASAERKAVAEREAAALKSMGVDGLSEDTVTAALADPHGPDAAKLKKQLLVLDDKLGNPVERRRAAEEAQRMMMSEVDALGAEKVDKEANSRGDSDIEEKCDGRAADGGAASASRGDAPWSFTHGPLKEKMAATIPGVGQARIPFLDPRLQLHLLQAFGGADTAAAASDVRSVTAFSLRKLLGLHSSAVSDALFKLFDSADVLLIARALISQILLSIFNEQLQADDIAVPEHAADAFISTFAQIAALVQEGSTPCSRLMVCRFIKEPVVKQLVLRAQPQTVDRIIELARRILRLSNIDINDDEEGASSPSSTLASSSSMMMSWSEKGPPRQQVERAAAVASSSASPPPQSQLQQSFSATFSLPHLSDDLALSENEAHELFSERGLRRVFNLYHSITNELAHMEAEAISADSETYLAHLDALARLEEHGIALRALSKPQILESLPPSLRARHGDKSLLYLTCVMSQLAVGSSATRVFRECRDALGEILSPQALRLFDNKRHREVFVSACATLPQVAVNAMERGEMLRALQGSTTMTSEVSAFVNNFMSERELRDTVSTIQAAHSNGYDVYTIDQLSDLLALVDFRRALSISDKEQLVRAVGRLPVPLCAFAGGDTNANDQHAAHELLRIVTSPTMAALLGPLKPAQLQMVFSQLRLQIDDPFFKKVMRRRWDDARATDVAGYRTRLLARLSPLGEQRLCFAVWRMSSRELRDATTRCTTVVEILRKINDKVVSEELLDCVPDPKLEGSYRLEFIQLVRDIALETDGRVSEQLWERSLRKVRAVLDSGAHRDGDENDNDDSDDYVAKTTATVARTEVIDALLESAHLHMELLASRALQLTSFSTCDAEPVALWLDAIGTGAGESGAGRSGESGRATPLAPLADAVAMLLNKDLALSQARGRALAKAQSLVRDAFTALRTLAACFLTDVPRVFFTQLAMNIDTFNIWDLFPTPAVRHALPLVLAALSMQSTSRHLFDQAQRWQGGDVAPSEDRGSVGRSEVVFRSDGLVLLQPSEVSQDFEGEGEEQWDAQQRSCRSNLIAALEALKELEDFDRNRPRDDPRFWQCRIARVRDIVSCVRNMTAAQVPMLLTVAANGLRQRRLGSLLAAIAKGIAAASAVSPPELDAAWLYSPPATALACAAALGPLSRADETSILEACAFFNVDKFSELTRDVRRGQLLRAVPDETVAHTVATLCDAVVAKPPHTTTTETASTPRQERLEHDSSVSSEAESEETTGRHATFTLFSIVHLIVQVDRELTSSLHRAAVRGLEGMRQSSARLRRAAPRVRRHLKQRYQRSQQPPPPPPPQEHSSASHRSGADGGHPAPGDLTVGPSIATARSHAVLQRPQESLYSDEEEDEEL